MEKEEREEEDERDPKRPRRNPPTNRLPLVYGNYDRYYGYRQPRGSDADGRLRLLRREWIDGKTCLDIGCNAGHFLLDVAKRFTPTLLVGVDIDPQLIGKAGRQWSFLYSLRQPDTPYAKVNEALAALDPSRLHDSRSPPPSSDNNNNSNDNDEEEEMGFDYFPISLPICFGHIPFCRDVRRDSEPFPNNVELLAMDYLHEEEPARRTYDVVFCLSLTKWVHLNWGDDGIKRLFHKIYRQLNPNGILLLEPQPFSTYKSRKNLTKEISENYKQIRLKPEQFEEFLLKQVGFASVEHLGVADAVSKGFQRPMYLYRK